ncbi:MAG: putative rane protein [Herbinix sp.]|jgi:hypothetical protein|nr:putative rane protein [Herbinix sp.]
MRNKRDMYINYERSYKKRRRKGNRWGMVVIMAILLIGLGIAAFYIIKTNMDKENNMDQTSREKTLEEATDVSLNQSPKVTDNLQISDQKPVPQVTKIPTPTIAIVNEPTKTPEVPKDTQVPSIVKGIYVTAPVAGSDSMNELINLVNTTEINAMVIDVKDDQGKISYEMDSAMAEKIGAVTNTISDMGSLVTTLKEHNIYLIARIVTFKDPFLAEQRQDLAIKNQDGSLFRDNNGEGWVNPYNHEVWNYLVEIATQAAAIGFDEVQFDYIRFSTGKGMSKVDFGKEAKKKSKEDIIIEFTKYIYEKLKPLGVYVSADVYGTIISSSIDAGLVGQNYVEMSKYLDYICPMIYPSHFGEGNYGIDYPDLEPYNIIRKALTASQTKLDQIPEEDHRAIVRPWLQDFTATWIKHHMKYGGAELKEQINGVYSAEYEEWLVWNAGCNYSEDGLLKQ